MDMKESDGASAYGASLAGRGFDLNKFVRQPQTIVRFLSWLFALVVFACITTEGYINPPESSEAKCVFNQNNSACQYAVGIGVLGFLACMAFLLLDVYVSFTSNVAERKYSVLADLGFSGVWTFLWFVCFCVLANEWSHTVDIRGIPQDAPRAVVAFSFFSIATWGILTYFALGRFRRGVQEVAVPTYVEAPLPDHHQTPYPPTYAPPSYNPTTYIPTAYATYPSSVSDVQQQPQGDATYQPPSF
ncbi:synaptogyrin-2b [Nelusetta ayraudi]|uniref:synaptogyrin-2b n=1 Tax=Nelusetta ayraudi TaxID=303726 RepID=UPI003F6FAA70